MKDESQKESLSVEEMTSIDIFFENLERIKEHLNGLEAEELNKRFLELIKDDFTMGFEIACEIQSLQLIELMFNKGASNFNKGLWIGCKKANKEIVELVIKHSTEENLDLNIGLYSACQEGNKELIDYMINKGANCLNDALGYSKDLETAKYLVEKGAEKKYMAFHFALENGAEIELVNFLNSGQAIVYTFCIACESGNIELIKHLAQTNQLSDLVWEKALRRASYSDNPQAIEFIISSTNIIFDHPRFELKFIEQISSFIDLSRFKLLLKYTNLKMNWDIFKLIALRGEMDLTNYALENMDIPSELVLLLSKSLSGEEVGVDYFLFKNKINLKNATNVLNCILNLALFHKNQSLLDFVSLYSLEIHLATDYDCLLKSTEDLD